MGSKPYSVPITDIIMFNENFEEYVDIKMTIQQSAIEAALANFWEAING
jgi:hypothetical protein